MGPSATGGSVTLGSSLFDSDPVSPDGLNVHVTATHDLAVNGPIHAGFGAVSLAADVRPDGGGDDGVGTLAVGPGAAVSGTRVTLRGADVQLDTGGDPASVAATGGRVDAFATGVSGPKGLAFDAQGNLYAANSFDGTVSRVTPGGAVTTFATGLGGPFRLAFDAAGDLYVSHPSDGTVSRVAPDGTVSTFATGFDLPQGLAFDAQGNLYVAEGFGRRVSRVAPDGGVTTFATDLPGPDGLAFDAAGNLYVATAGDNSVRRVAPDGTVTTFAAGFAEPTDLAFDAEGHLLVTTRRDEALSRVAPDGTVTRVATGLRGPFGVAVDARGDVFVTAGFDTTIAKLSGSADLTVQSSLPARPIAVGGLDAGGGGIHLTDAELAALSARDTMIVGDAGQGGDITFVTAAFDGTPVVVRQAAAGPGRVVLDDGGGPAPALGNGAGTVRLSSGTGGILAATDANAAAEVAAGRLVLDTAGSVGTAARRLQTQVGGAVEVQTALPTGVFLDGLADLTLGNVRAAAGAVVDVTARGSLTAAGAVSVPAGTISLAADVRPDGVGDDGVGTLVLGRGAAVDGESVALRGADVHIETVSIPAAVRTRQVRPFAAGFDGSAGLAFDAQGNLYVASSGNGTVSRVAPDGTVTPFAAGFDGPAGLAFDAQGNLYVANNFGTTVSRVAPDGTVTPFAAGLSGPFGLAFDAAGNLHVANSANGTVSRVTPDGTVSTFATGFGVPAGLAFDAQGNLYVGNAATNIITRVTPDGSAAAFAAGFGTPAGLAFDAQGNLYVASFADSRVQRVAPDGTVSPVATVGFPLGLAIDGQGVVYVPSAGRRQRAADPAGQPDDPLLAPRPPPQSRRGGHRRGRHQPDRRRAGRPGTHRQPHARRPRPDGRHHLHLGNSGGRFRPGAAEPDQPGRHRPRERRPGAGPDGPRRRRHAGGRNRRRPRGQHRPGRQRRGRRHSAPGYLGVGRLRHRRPEHPDSSARDQHRRRQPVPRQARDLATTGTVTAGGVLGLNLAGDFTTRSGDLQAPAVHLLLTGNGTQHLDSGGLAVASVVRAGFGTAVLRSGLTVTGNLHVAAGELDAGGHPLTVGGAATMDGVLSTGSAAHAFAGGLVVRGEFRGGSGPVTAGGVTLSAGGRLVAPATLTVTGDWFNTGGVLDANGGTVAFAAAGAQRLTSGGQAFHDLIHTGAGLLTLTDDLTLIGDFTNANGAGSVDATGRTVRVAGDWSWGGNGRLVSTGSTVELNGTTQAIDGNTTFFNLTRAGAGTLTFAAGSTQTVLGTVTLQGEFGAPLALRSDTSGQRWNLNPRGGRLVSFLDVQDGRNLSRTVLRPTASHDSGNNLGWVFPVGTQTWAGTASADWDDAANWSAGFVPNPGTAVTLAAAPFQPALSSPVTVSNLTIGGGATLTLAGHGLTVKGRLTNRGTLALRGDEPVRLARGNDTAQGTWRYTGGEPGTAFAVKDFGATDYFDLVVDGPGDTFRPAGTLTVRGALRVSAGTFDGSASGTVRVGGLAVTGGAFVAPAAMFNSGDWSVAGGTFDANGGTVTLNGRGQKVLGATTFFNLAKAVTAADTLTFEAGATQTVAGKLTLRGAAGRLLALRSTASGSRWVIDHRGATDVRFVDVQDGESVGPAALSAAGSRDSGNNAGWLFT